MSKKSNKSDFIPPSAIVLHTPWQVDKNDKYVGIIADPLLIQCTFKSELEKSTSIFIDRFLSMSGKTILEKSKRAIIDQRPSSHQHGFSHTQSFDTSRSIVTGGTRIDGNNIGHAKAFSAPNHVHDISLDIAGGAVSEEDTNQIHEPLHYEVSAYWVDPDRNERAAVHAGMIVFSKSRLLEAPGWQRMDRKALKRDKREVDSGYTPRKWRKETLKVVGCIPSKHRKGQEFHTHILGEHSHSGSVSGKRGTVDADDSSGNQGVAKINHTHKVESVSAAPQAVVEYAVNLGLHRKLEVWVATQDGAPIVKGMMIPFIPRTKEEVDALIDEKLWGFDPEPNETADVSVTPTSGNFGSHRNPKEETGSLHGSNLHSHRYKHDHIVNLSPAFGVTIADQDDEVLMASTSHTHEGAFVQKEVESSFSRNPNRYRRVMLITRLWD